MEFTTGFAGCERALVDLFAAAFAASEGAEEGVLIAGLVRDLLSSTPAADLWVFRAEEDGRPIGAAVFTRLTYAEDPRHVVRRSDQAANARGQVICGAFVDHQVLRSFQMKPASRAYADRMR